MRGHDSSDYIHISYWTWWGLGHERTVAIYDKNTEVLKVMTGCASKLDRILDVLRRTSSLRPIGHGPVVVKYW